MSAVCKLPVTREAWFEREGLALLTDFYELTMMAGYLKEGRADQRCAFDYFFRSLPPHNGFAVSTGLDVFLDYLDALKFSESDIDYLRGLDVFDDEFLEHLGRFRHNLDVRAVPEGTLVYPFEPIIQVEGTIFETQLIESALLNIMNYQTLIATKAARIYLAAEGEPVMEFGLRRAHGPDGGVSGSRAAYIGGCASTSNVLAGKSYGIPVSGTHAHSWVMSCTDELDAFRKFAGLYPNRCVLLVDTYNTETSGVPNAIQVFKELEASGIKVRPAIRLDSGDLGRLSKIAYKMMIDAGLKDPLIVASNDLDEDLIADLKRQGAKINAWGVGTHLITAGEHPAFNGVYKLVAIEEGGSWNPRVKVSSNIEKATDPGRKQLVRYYAADGAPLGDVMYLDTETPQEGEVVRGRSRTWPQHETRIKGVARSEQVLKPVVSGGKRLRPSEPVADARERALGQIAALPEESKRMRNPEIYRVLLSAELAGLKDELIEAAGG